jgi:uncharacterized membrane protein
MLSQGQILLSAEDGNPSGGNVDIGLLNYMARFTPLITDRSHRLSAADIAEAKTLTWTGEDLYQAPSGTAYYLPLVYVPQATGLGLGKLVGASVDTSYRLARFLSLLASGLLLAFAFRLYRPSVAVIALLALPMTLFQFGAAVLDPMATAMSILAISAFMRISLDKEATKPWVFAALAICTLVVTACRANMLPLLLLPLASYWFTRDRRHLMIGVATALFVMAWTALTIKSTVYSPNITQTNHSARLIAYLTHPGELGRILFSTWTHPVRMLEYATSFIGVLGWLDTPFKPVFYKYFGALLFVVLLSCVTLSNWRQQWKPRGLLLFICASSILLTFIALLVQWTKPGATLIEGVQGRYLLIPILCALYAVTGQPQPGARMMSTIRNLLVIVLIVISGKATADRLLERYAPLPPQKEQQCLSLPPAPSQSPCAPSAIEAQSQPVSR